jgi:hypothetical protein
MLYKSGRANNPFACVAVALWGDEAPLGQIIGRQQSDGRANLFDCSLRQISPTGSLNFLVFRAGETLNDCSERRKKRSCRGFRLVL